MTGAQPVRDLRGETRSLRLLCLLAIGATAGCGGGGGDTSSGGGTGPAPATNRAPVVTALSLSTDAVDFMAGSGRAPIVVTARYTDPDADEASLRVQLSDGATPVLAPPSSVVAIVPSAVGQFDLATDTARRLTLEAWVVDTAGNASNRMSATLTVRGNARLSTLGLSAGALEQIFQPGLADYTATVGLLRPTTTVTATAEDPAATVTVEGRAVASGAPSGKLTLASGRNDIEVAVTATDGTTATYRIAVTRRSVDTFGQELYIKSDAPEGSFPGTSFEPRPSHFGAALALDGARLAVGAWGEDSAGARDGGVLYLYTRDDGGPWRREARLGTPSDLGGHSGPEPHFGTNVALDGAAMFVAEIWSNEGWPTHLPMFDGRVHVFARELDQWVLKQTLVPAPRPQLHSRFGVGLAAQGETLVVGDPVGAQVLNRGPQGTEAYGAVSVFAPSATGWVQSHFLTHPAPDLEDEFGAAVALDGDLLAIGVPGDDSASNGITGDPHDDSLVDSGAVFVLRREAGAWVPDAVLKAPNADAGDGFGDAVRLAGDTLVVSAPFEDGSAAGIGGNLADNGAATSGAVYVFSRTAAGVWAFEAYVKASNAAAGDAFGLASDFNFSPLALADDVLVVGAQGEDGGALGVNGDPSSNAMPSAGAVYVFTRDAERRWTQAAYLKASNASSSDAFGSVALGEDLLVVGAAFESSIGVGFNGDQAHHALSSGQGAAYVFR